MRPQINERNFPVSIIAVTQDEAATRLDALRFAKKYFTDNPPTEKFTHIRVLDGPGQL